MIRVSLRAVSQNECRAALRWHFVFPKNVEFRIFVIVFSNPETMRNDNVPGGKKRCLIFDIWSDHKLDGL